MNLFFDFDGTLIDSRKRLYTLFQDLVPESNLSFDEYWRLKRSNISNKEILIHIFKYNLKQVSEFYGIWMSLIEREYYLRLDTPITGVNNYLKTLLEKRYSISLVTARQFRLGVEFQLKNYGWNSYFDNIFVTEQRVNKSSLIKPYIATNLKNFIVGDTRDDIMTGYELGIPTVAVLTGFHSREILEKNEPNLIVESVVHFKPWEKVKT